MAIKSSVLDDFFEEKEITLQDNKKNYSTYKIYEEPKINHEVKTHTAGKTSKTKEEQEKGKQKDNKRGTQPITKGKQKDNKRVTENTLMGNKRGTQPITKRVTKRVTNDEVLTETFNAISASSSLVGLQRKTLHVIFQLCKLNGSNTTTKTTSEYLSSLVGSNKNTVKTTLNRLKQKNLIEIESYKVGRSGWIKYKIPQNIYVDLLKREYVILPELSLGEKGNKRGTQPITKRVTNEHSSSSIYINTTTEELPDLWISINIAPLEDIGFSKSQLKQLSAIPQCVPEVVQDAIYQFAFDLAHNGLTKKLKSPPLNVLMGVLRKGQGWSADGYKSPQELAVEKLLKRKQEDKERLESKLKALYTLEFDEWVGKKSDSELREIYAKQAGSGAGVFKYGGLSHAPTKALISKYFEENIWIEKKKEILGETKQT